MASIRKRTNGTYQAAIYMGKDESGKKKYTYVTCDRKKDCEEKAREIEYQIQNNIYINPTEITVGEYLDEWFNVYCKNLAITTQELYQMYIRVHIKPNLGGIKLTKLMPLQIQAFYNQKLETQKQ